VAVRLLVLYNNERNSLSFQAVLSNFKDIVIYFQNLLTFNYRQISQWYFNSVICGDGCVCKQHQSVNKNGQFFTQLRLNTSVDRHILPSGCVSAPLCDTYETWTTKIVTKISKQPAIDKYIRTKYFCSLPPWRQAWWILSSKIFFQNTPSSVLWLIQYFILHKCSF